MKKINVIIIFVIIGILSGIVIAADNIILSDASIKPTDSKIEIPVINKAIVVTDYTRMLKESKDITLDAVTEEQLKNEYSDAINKVTLSTINTEAPVDKTPIDETPINEVPIDKKPIDEKLPIEQSIITEPAAATVIITKQEKINGITFTYANINGKDYTIISAK
jgi:hypothetical protein